MYSNYLIVRWELLFATSDCCFLIIVLLLMKIINCEGNCCKWHNCTHHNHSYDILSQQEAQSILVWPWTDDCRLGQLFATAGLHGCAWELCGQVNWVKGGDGVLYQEPWQCHWGRKLLNVVEGKHKFLEWLYSSLCLFTVQYNFLLFYNDIFVFLDPNLQ